MIAYILAAIGGYLIGDSIKSEKKLARGGETYGEYAVRVKFSESDGSGHAYMYDVEASSDDEAVEMAKSRFMDDYGPFSGVKFKSAEIVRMEEIPMYSEGGQTYKFTFKTTDEYESSRRDGYFEYDTVEVDVDDPKVSYSLYPKSQEEFEKIKRNNKIKSVKPVRLWWDPMDIYDEPDDDGSDEYDERDEYAEGGEVIDEKILMDAYVQGGKSGFNAASGKDFKTYEDWAKDKKIKTHRMYKRAYEGGGKSGFNAAKGREFLSFEEWRSGGMASGGKVKFEDKVVAISSSLEGKKVPKRLKKDYGETYDATEAKEAARRIAGSQLKKSGEKEETTAKKDKFVSANALRKNKTKPMPTTTTKKGEKIKLISAHAKKIWDKEKGEKWKDAIKRASVELKKQNKI